jgi:hypothetical protein
VRYVVLPEYRADQATSLQAIPRSMALQRVLEQSFNLRGHGAEGVGRLVEMLADAECYALRVGGLAPAVEALRRLVGAA